MSKSSYFTTLLEEKGIDLETPIVVTSLHNGTENHLTLQHVVDFILRKPARTQAVIRKKLVYIDYRNGDVLDFFKYIARFMAVSLPLAFLAFNAGLVSRGGF